METATKNVRVVATLGILLIACALLSIGSAKPAEAAFPGENGQIAFQSNRDGTNIHTIDPTGGTATNLTPSKGGSDPAFSPDGNRIAFVSGGSLGYDIFVMNADGSGRSQLTNTGSADSDPTWSSDGTKIAFVSNTFSLDGQSDSEIWVMNADGSDPHPITSNSFPDTRPAWSPLGDKIAFVSARTGDTNRNVYIMNADGSGQASLTPDSPTGCSPTCYQGHDDDPAWSPDGSKIAYVHGYGPPTNPYAGGGVPNIWTMDPNGDNHTNVSKNPDISASMPAWSPDGSKIAYVHVAVGTDRNIAVMNADGSGQEAPPIDTNTAHDINPDWGVAPDVTAPEVSTTTPTSGQTGVSRSIPGLTATFSEEMDSDTLTPSSVKLSVYNKKKGKYVPVTNTAVSCDEPCQTATLDPYPSDPAKLLAANKKYKVTVTTGVEDKVGNALAQSKVWIFRTGSS